MNLFLKFIFGIKLYMFRTVRLSIIRSFFTAHTTMVYVILKFHKWVKLLVYTRVHCSQNCRTRCTSNSMLYEK